MRFRSAFLALCLTTAFALPAAAVCVGSGSFRTCTDMSGNTYNVQRFGNTTTVQGYNPNTGSNWNSTTQSLGGTSITNGTASNGHSWSETQQNLGGGFRSVTGTNSRGQSYNYMCGPFGCN